MSTPSPKPFCEPEENEFAARDEAPSVERNAALYAGLLRGLLDQIDDAMRRAIDHGLKAELRAIVAKHLTDFPASAPSAPAPSSPGPGGRLAGLTAEQVNTMLGLHNCVQVLDEHARRAKADSPSAKRAASCRDFLRGEIEKLKGGAR